ncbi:ArsR/SmtB family transcription factor [Halopiger aswanensis]|uniref:ArsR family transcriptional regulator n=1 Tax=Halopiger aswanensis TaxID=148449 RepID=A0A3R7I095_9EURY|nr:helix-turn-helix domain-containing protein [Halopiger aswanensis]RKD98297.1 ArsR family transcriptional regulator [Halopiger aswanensis]
MARLFPFRSETSPEEGQPRVVELEGEDADAVFSALSSTTARRIYARLDEEPGTPSDVADAIDSSIQNVRYHLENLEEAGLVEVVDTWYSSRGNEMSVYATTDGPLIVTSDESTASQLKTALSRLIGGIGALAGGSLLVQYGLTEWFGAARTESAGDGGGAGGANGAAVSESNDAADDRSGNGNGAEGNGADSADSSDGDEEGGDDMSIAEESSDSADGDGGTDTADAGAEDGADAGGDSATDINETFDAAPDGGDGTLENAADGGAEAADAVLQTVPPGLLFFLGGLAVLLAVTLYWYWYRPAY